MVGALDGAINILKKEHMSIDEDKIAAILIHTLCNDLHGKLNLSISVSLTPYQDLSTQWDQPSVTYDLKMRREIILMDEEVDDNVVRHNTYITQYGFDKGLDQQWKMISCDQINQPHPQ